MTPNGQTAHHLPYTSLPNKPPTLGNTATVCPLAQLQVTNSKSDGLNHRSSATFHQYLIRDILGYNLKQTPRTILGFNCLLAMMILHVKEIQHIGNYISSNN